MSRLYVRKESKFLKILLLCVMVFVAGINSRNILADDTSVIEKVVVEEVPATSVEGKEATSSVTVIERNEILASGKQDVLSLVSGRVPGVFVTERGVSNYGVGPGSAGNISIRGIGGSPNTDVLVLLDGQPTKMGLFGHPIPDAYPLDAVERVEVLRGPKSLRYGDNAMGGLINIVTISPPADGTRTDLKAGYGQYNTLRASVSHSGRVGPVGYVGSLIRRKSDGSRSDSDFDGWNGYAKMQIKMNDETNLSFSGWGTSFDVQDPGPLNDPEHADFRKAKRGGITAILNGGEALPWSIMAYGEWGDHDFSKSPEDWKSRDRTLGLIARKTWQITQKDFLEVGGEVQEFGGKGEKPEEGTFYGEHYETSWGLYIQDEHVVTEQLLVQAGGRVQRSEGSDTVFLPKLGFSYDFNDKNRFHGQIARGYRAPTIRDRILFPISNKSLSAEDLWSAELGCTHIFGEAFSLDLTGFYIDADNLIVFQAPPPQFANSGKARNRGIEISANWYSEGPLEMIGSYTYLDKDENISGSARHVLSCVSILRFNKWTAWLDLQYVNDLQLLSKKESYFVADARVAYRINNNIEAGVSINNITDEEYKEIEGYPMPGRWVFGEIRVGF
ncbi:MAG: TonB-dependent receptor [Candidatus Theseobacter exili]|nr:TonB-dependent receptor [Candidatus Theseobacter exili]